VSIDAAGRGHAAGSLFSRTEGRPMTRLATAAALTLVALLAAGCGDSREKNKNKDLDRPKPAEKG